MATNIKLKIDSEIHNHLDHAFDFLDFSDDQNDTYDEPYNKTTFDSFVDPNGTVTWKNGNQTATGTQITVTGPGVRMAKCTGDYCNNGDWALAQIRNDAT